MKAVHRGIWGTARRVRMLVSTLALLVGGQLASPLHAEFSRQQLIDYVKAAWKLTDITDELLSETLDTSYSGIPFKDYVSYFAAAPGILNPLANGDYRTAGRKAAELGFERMVSFGLRRAGLAGVAAPARLAAWPIEHGLNAF